MGIRWNPLGFHLNRLPCFVVLMLFLETHGCWSLNLEGLALLGFRMRVDTDPYGAFANWNLNDGDPCMWLGVHCVDGKVQKLILYKNCFSGVIPKEIGGLTMLELLDLRNNNLSGTIPAEISEMLSLKCLLLCDNKFQGRIPPEFGKLNLHSELQFNQNLASDMLTGIGSPKRKFGHRFKFREGYSHVHGEKGCKNLLSSSEPYIVQNVQGIFNFVRRRLLQESSNLPAAPASGGAPPEQMVTSLTTRSSGAFPAMPNEKKRPNPPPSYSPSPTPNLPQFPSTNTQSSQSPGMLTDHEPVGDGLSGTKRRYVLVVPGVAFLFTVAAAMLCASQSQRITNIGPWKTGLSGQLQKAFVTGVPKLNRSELETACENFSNIITTLSDCTVYKGTLSSGVEIAVALTAISSSKDWLKRLEMAYRKKIETLSWVNHKNFVNLLGYCEEDEPFLRMMVFEYAPNGTLFEHLHVKEAEHLDWNARMRIIMGTSYCLQYMHHELNPPLSHSNLQSSAVYLTDDYAAKIGEISFWTDLSTSKISGEDELGHSELPPVVDPETDVYNFGILLLEIISGKLSYSEEQGSLVNWAAEYLNNKRSIGYLIDPMLKSFKNTELDIICEVIHECIHQDPRQRPTMREVTSKLREVIDISPDAATPRLSPLWWAELEILSVEAT